ncbi:MAG: DDE-type integrase/transposase/recombinase [Proteobacteria bacterium]|nr:DDE-type integrase/transposase/recombinase [Pseudomonadota bacterium]
MKHLPIGSISQIDKFLKDNKGMELEIMSVREKYEFLKIVLLKIRYNSLSKKDKHLVLKYLKFFTKYSKGHLKKLIKKWKRGLLFYNPSRNRNKFSSVYDPVDIALLIKTDIAHNHLSGPAAKRILKREFKVFGKMEYENISNISVAHIYNIRNHNLQYGSSQAKFFKRTQATQVNIGVRRKPEPNGKPGYLRVDTVHQGDLNGKKGVYHINLVDEITQFEMIATIPQICELYLRPVVEEILKLFPFAIYEFHADNGSEYINRAVAEMLNKLHIELSKSRSRHSNDNALVESKNGSIVRKFYGRNFINQKHAGLINDFNEKYLNIYLNYHRPCGFAEDMIGAKGKVKKKYNEWIVPYEKLKSLENAKQYLKPGFNFDELDKIAYAESDNDFAEKMMKEKDKLFKKIGDY